jgi:ribosomal protein S18 acetylase RimI-like enzyme
MRTIIRQGALEDLNALIAFDDIARASEERRSLLRQGLNDSGVSVALVDGTPKGYALLNYRFFGHAFIELVYVCADDRRSGIGSALIQYVSQNANGSKLFTSTNRSNTPMQALLAKLGFEESGIIHNLDPGDPELVYFKRLSGR